LRAASAWPEGGLEFVMKQIAALPTRRKLGTGDYSETRVSGILPVEAAAFKERPSALRPTSSSA